MKKILKVSRERVPKATNAPIQEKELVDFIRQSMTTYGVEVNLERAIPDLRDGLKPVGRRALWAMNNIQTPKGVKAARLIGDTMGMYHPHGDLSLFGAICNLVNNPVAPLTGKGNWGTLVDQPAAMRYPNVLLSRFGQTFFGKNYTATTELVWNFDRSRKEPLVLPALLPNLLFNGASGIGVGVVTEIPAFTPKSVLTTMVRLLDGEDLKAEDYFKHLEFYYQYGGVVAKTPENKKAIRSFFENSKGTVQWNSPLEIDEAKKQVTLFRFAPGIRPVVLIEGVTGKDGKKKKRGIKDWDEVSRVYAGKGLSYVIQARKDLNLNEFKLLCDKLRKITTTKVSYEINVTERLPDPSSGDDKYKVNFFTCSVPQLMRKWLKWRCQLEAKSLDWQIAKSKKEIAFLELLIYASDKLDIIFKALRTEAPATFMVKNMNITLEQANQILDLQVRRLSKLDQSKLKSDLKTAKEALAVLVKKRKAPSKEVRAFLVAAAEKFEKYSEWAGTVQYAMGSTKTTEKGDQPVE
jgi:DNA gyrase/topoisomerase IV subunit A